MSEMNDNTQIEKMLEDFRYPVNEQHKESLRKLLFERNSGNGRDEIRELLMDAEFVKEFMNQEDIMGVHKLFEDRGVPLSIYELKKLGRTFKEEIQKAALQNQEAYSEELSMDELEEVAGGQTSNLGQKLRQDIIRIVSNYPKNSIKDSWFQNC
jgi:hypothetical protein